MSHALSVIGEAGIEGFRYESGVIALFSKCEYRSRKGRWMLASSPVFSPDEFRYILAYAAKAGFVDAGSHQENLARGELSATAWHIHLTLAGWEHIELYDRTLLGQWIGNLKTNWPTILISIAAALLSAWLLYYWGPPQH